MGKKEIISDEMFLLGRKFSEMAAEARSAKSAKTAFDLAERAYKLVLKSEPEKPSDLTMAFLAGIMTQMLRSDLWREYVSYCQDHECIPISKSELFRRMEIMEFSTVRKNNGFQVIPPKQIV